MLAEIVLRRRPVRSHSLELRFASYCLGGSADEPSFAVAAEYLVERADREGLPVVSDRIRSALCQGLSLAEFLKLLGRLDKGEASGWWRAEFEDVLRGGADSATGKQRQELVNFLVSHVRSGTGPKRTASDFTWGLEAIAPKGASLELKELCHLIAQDLPRHPLFENARTLEFLAAHRDHCERSVIESCVSRMLRNEHVWGNLGCLSSALDAAAYFEVAGPLVEQYCGPPHRSKKETLGARLRGMEIPTTYRSALEAYYRSGIEKESEPDRLRDVAGRLLEKSGWTPPTVGEAVKLCLEQRDAKRLIALGEPGIRAALDRLAASTGPGKPGLAWPYSEAMKELLDRQDGRAIYIALQVQGQELMNNHLTRTDSHHIKDYDLRHSPFEVMALCYGIDMKAAWGYPECTVSDLVALPRFRAGLERYDHTVNGLPSDLGEVLIRHIESPEIMTQLGLFAAACALVDIEELKEPIVKIIGRALASRAKLHPEHSFELSTYAAATVGKISKAKDRHNAGVWPPVLHDFMEQALESESELVREAASRAKSDRDYRGGQGAFAYMGN